MKDFSLKNQMVFLFSVQWAHRNSVRTASTLPAWLLGRLRCSLAPRLHDREHAGWGLHKPGFPPYTAWPCSFFSCPPLCLSPPAVLSGVSQYPSGPPQGRDLPGVQPAAPTLPHEAPSHLPPVLVLKTVGRGERTRETKGVDCSVLFIYFLSFFFPFKSASLWDQNNRQCRVTNHVILLVEWNVLPPQEGVYVIVHIL